MDALRWLQRTNPLHEVLLALLRTALGTTCESRGAGKDQGGERIVRNNNLFTITNIVSTMYLRNTDRST